MLESNAYAAGFTLPKIDLDLIAESLSGDVERLRGSRMLITGGTGFFGAWLVEGLLYAADKHGISVELELVSRSPEAFSRRMPHIATSKAVRFVEGDVRTLDIGSSPRYDYVIHAAGDSGGAQKSNTRLHMAETIVDGARNILRIAEATGAKAVLYVSSGAVYGRRAPLDRDEIDEEYPGGPLITDRDIDHDESKRMAEALCRVYATELGLAVKIARCFAFIGPYLPLDAHFAAGNFIRDVLAGRELVIEGDGESVRTYLYAADLAVWLLRILLDGKAGQPYNIAGNEPITALELAKRAAAYATPGVDVRVLGKLGSPGSRIVASTRLATTELGVKQCTNLSEALRKTIEWHRSRTAG